MQKEENFLVRHSSIQEKMIMLELKRIISHVRTNGKHNTDEIEHIKSRLLKVEDSLKNLNSNLEKILTAILAERAPCSENIYLFQQRRILH